MRVPNKFKELARFRAGTHVVARFVDARELEGRDDVAVKVTGELRRVLYAEQVKEMRRRDDGTWPSAFEREARETDGCALRELAGALEEDETRARARRLGAAATRATARRATTTTTRARAMGYRRSWRIETDDGRARTSIAMRVAIAISHAFERVRAERASRASRLERDTVARVERSARSKSCPRRARVASRPRARARARAEARGARAAARRSRREGSCARESAPPPRRPRARATTTRARTWPCSSAAVGRTCARYTTRASEGRCEDAWRAW